MRWLLLGGGGEDLVESAQAKTGSKRKGGAEGNGESKSSRVGGEKASDVASSSKGSGITST